MRERDTGKTSPHGKEFSLKTNTCNFDVGFCLLTTTFQIDTDLCLLTRHFIFRGWDWFIREDDGGQSLGSLERTMEDSHWVH